MAPFSFGNPSPAPAIGAFSGVGAPSTGFGTQPSSSAATAAPTIQVQSPSAAFPDLSVYNRVLEAIKNPVDLPTFLEENKAFLLNVHEVQKAPVLPDARLRAQLQQNPTVLLEGNTPASLQPHILKEVFAIADDLRVSEVTALALYHKASQFRAPFKSAFCDELLAGSPSSAFRRSTTVCSMAREFYFDQLPSRLLACRALLHGQLREAQHPVAWTSELVHPLLQLVKVSTRRMEELLPYTMNNPDDQSNTAFQNEFLWKVRMPLELCRWERLLAAECLFFIAYQVNIGDAAVPILDVLHELSDSLPVMDPFRDVPNPRIESGKDKDEDVWKEEWINSALGTGKPDLLLLCSVLTVTLLAAQQRADEPLPAQFLAHLNNWKRPDFVGILDSRSGHTEWQNRLQWQSFTLARQGVFPVLLTTTHFDTPEISPREFYLATLVVWGERSLRGAVGNAISKRKWEEEMREHVRQQQEQHQQRVVHGQFGTVAPQFSLDIPHTPDCLDDVVSLCTSLFSLDQNFAAQFWTDDEGQEPPKVVRWLETQQKSDTTLQPCFVSLLGALACSAPDGVYQLQEWESHLEYIRRYTQLLNPQSDQRLGSQQYSAPTSSKYYYISQHTAGASTSQRSDGSTTSSFPKEGDTAGLLSRLYLISMVAKFSSVARVSLVAMDVPVRNGRETVNRDSLLSILMTLSVQALSPTVRGAVLSVIATLLRCDDCKNEQELSSLRKASTEVWELLERSQILPINQLQQSHHSMKFDPATQKTGLAFPQSSIDIAKSRMAKSETCPFRDPRFGILYEMEHVESSLGYYPSTEGFLRVLATLFAGGGCPPGLGQDWRERPGCLPYLEYVIRYVLPRASGNYSTKALPSLEFRVVDDRDRFEWLALRVVEAALVRYNIPSPELLQSYAKGSQELVEDLRQCSEEAAAVALGYEYLERLLFVPPVDFAEAKRSCEDFLELPSEDPSSLYQRNSRPRSQMPGFFAIVELLSERSSPFFKSLLSVLTDYREDIRLKRTLNDWIRVRSLYLSTWPSFATAKVGACRVIHPYDRQELVPNYVNPPQDCDLLEEDSVQWSTKAMRSALVVLGAVLARESSFVRATEGKRISYLPVLQFSGIGAETLHLPPATGLSFNVPPHALEALWVSLAKKVGFVSFNRDVDLQVSSVATGVLFYLLRTIGPQRVPNVAQKILSQSLALQLETYAGRQESKGHTDFADFILEHILLELRCGYTILFANLLLDSSSPLFKALLSLLSTDSFLIGNTKLASSSLEIIFLITTRTNDPSSIVSVSKRSEYLRSIDFWVESVRRIFDFSAVVPRQNFTLSLSWILRSVAQQLYFLSGAVAGLSASPQLHPLLPGLPEKVHEYVIELLGNDGLMFKSLEYISLGHSYRPAETPRVFDDRAARDALGKSFHSTTGPFKEIHSDKLLRKLRQIRGCTFDEQELKRWIEQWNRSITEESDSAHLSESVADILGSLQIVVKYGLHPMGSDFSSCMQQLLVDLLKQADSYNQQRIAQDIHCYPHTANNLATSIAFATDFLCGAGRNVVDVSSIFMTLTRSAVATTRVLQISKQNDRDMGIERERVVKLVASLSNMSTTFSTAIVLEDEFSSLVAFDLQHEGSPELRSMISSLLDFSQIAPEDVADFCGKVLSRQVVVSSSKQSILQALISLLPNCDATVAPLLTIFSAVDGIPLSSFDCLFQRLVEAGGSNRLHQKAALDATTYGQKQPGAPGFLLGHLDLVLALMKQSGAGQGITKQFLGFLQAHDAIFARLFHQFPTDGDVLFSLLRCILQFVRCQKNQNETSGVNEAAFPLSLKERVEDIVRLSVHIAEYPLPSVERTPTTWWNGLGKVPNSPSLLDDETCAFAVHGAEFARCGLLLGLELGVVAQFDCEVLSRCLFRCADTAMQLVNQMNDTIANRHHGGDEKTKLTAAIVDMICVLLVVSISVIRTQAGFSSKETTLSTFRHVLKNSRLDSLMRACARGDENTITPIQSHLSLLRKECAGRGGAEQNRPYSLHYT